MIGAAITSSSRTLFIFLITTFACKPFRFEYRCIIGRTNSFPSIHVSSSLVFTDTLLNIFARHISNKMITFNDKDASWITSVVKSSIRSNSRVYREWVMRGRNLMITTKSVKYKTQQIKLFVKLSAGILISWGGKLSDPQTGQKHFWTAFKRITNKKKAYKYSAHF